jgi:hypothetical protein
LGELPSYLIGQTDVICKPITGMVSRMQKIGFEQTNKHQEAFLKGQVANTLNFAGHWAKSGHYVGTYITI